MSLRTRPLKFPSFTGIGTVVLSVFLIAGTIIMLFLLILAGAYDKQPLNQIFFLQADTRDIPNAPDGTCHWTLYNFCDERNGRNFNCRPNNAAYPFLPQRNFNTETNIPGDFIQNPGRYFYLSRFLYSFYIIDVAFASLAFIAGLLAICSRIGREAAALFSCIALFCVTFSATIMTGCFVLGQQAFQRAGRRASVGVKAFAFTWTCVALLTLATIGFCLSCLTCRNKNRHVDRSHTSSGWSGVRRRQSVDGRYNEKETANGYHLNDSQRRLNPDVTNPDVELNAPAALAPATGHETGR